MEQKKNGKKETWTKVKALPIATRIFCVIWLIACCLTHGSLFSNANTATRESNNWIRSCDKSTHTHKHIMQYREGQKKTDVNAIHPKSHGIESLFRISCIHFCSGESPLLGVYLVKMFCLEWINWMLLMVFSGCFFLLTWSIIFGYFITVSVVMFVSSMWMSTAVWHMNSHEHGMRSMTYANRRRKTERERERRKEKEMQTFIENVVIREFY